MRRDLISLLVKFLPAEHDREMQTRVSIAHDVAPRTHVGAGWRRFPMKCLESWGRVAVDRILAEAVPFVPVSVLVIGVGALESRFADATRVDRTPRE